MATELIRSTQAKGITDEEQSHRTICLFESVCIICHIIFPLSFHNLGKIETMLKIELLLLFQAGVTY